MGIRMIMEYSLTRLSCRGDRGGGETAGLLLAVGGLVLLSLIAGPLREAGMSWVGSLMDMLAQDIRSIG